MQETQTRHQEIVNALQDATAEFFGTVLGQEILANAPTESSETFDGPRLCGLIGIVGKLSGYICSHLPLAMALKIAGQMLGTSTEPSIEDAKDAVGEFINIIAGSASTKLSQAAASSQFEVTLPTIIEGNSFAMRAPGGGSRFHLPFSYDGTTFFVEICVKGRV